MTTVTAPAAAALRSRAHWTSAATLGLLLAAAVPMTMLVAGIAAGLPVGEDLTFFLITAAVALLGAGLTWRFGAWGKALGTVLAVLVGMALFWMAFGLAYPSSAIDFVPGVLLPVGVLLGIGGNVAALVAGRRDHRAAEAPPAERRLTRAVLGVVAVAAVASSALTLVGQESVEAAAASDAVVTTMRNLEFSEESLRVPAGEPTQLLIRNEDPLLHTFTVPALGVDRTVGPGSEVVVELTADAGEYTFYCVPHSDTSEPDPERAGMAGRLVAE